jgi:hypothetical protein
MLAYYNYHKRGYINKMKILTNADIDDLVYYKDFFNSFPDHHNDAYFNGHPYAQTYKFDPIIKKTHGLLCISDIKNYVYMPVGETIIEIQSGIYQNIHTI